MSNQLAAPWTIRSAAARESSRRTRARQAARGLTFAELLARSRQTAGARPGSLGDPAVLAYVLRDEVRRGRIEYHSTSGRYILNGHLPAEVREALLDLRL